VIIFAIVVVCRIYSITINIGLKCSSYQRPSCNCATVLDICYKLVKVRNIYCLEKFTSTSICYVKINNVNWSKTVIMISTHMHGPVKAEFFVYLAVLPLVTIKMVAKIIVYKKGVWLAIVSLFE